MEQLKIQKEFWDYIVSGNKIAEIRKPKHAHLAGQWVEMVCVDTGNKLGKVEFLDFFKGFNGKDHHDHIAKASIKNGWCISNKFIAELVEKTKAFLETYNNDGTLIVLDIINTDVY